MVCEKGHVCVSFEVESYVQKEWVVGGGLHQDTLGSKGSQMTSISVWNDFTGDAFTISVRGLFQNGTARMLSAHWQRRVNIAIGGTYRRGHVGLRGLDG